MQTKLSRNSRKMKQLLFIMVMVFILLVGCGENDINPEDSDILYVPQFGFSELGISKMKSRIAYGSNQSVSELSFHLMHPLLTGIVPNENKIQHGAEMITTVLGSVLTVTTSVDKANKIVTVNGTFDDGVSFINMTFYNAKNTFDYEQYIVVKDDPSDPPAMSIGWAIVYMKATNVALDSNLAYHLYLEGYSLQPMNTAVMEIDIFCGKAGNDRIAGTYIHVWRGADPQPSIDPLIDPLTISLSNHQTYFTNQANWTDPSNDHSQDTFVYWNLNSKTFFADTTTAGMIQGFTGIDPCPWTPLPKP